MIKQDHGENWSLGAVDHYMDNSIYVSINFHELKKRSKRFSWYIKKGNNSPYFLFSLLKIKVDPL